MKKIGSVTAASIAAFALGATLAGGMVVASADSNSGGPQRGPHRAPGELVTGEDAQKAIAAATAAVPGTTDHVHKTPEGEYLVRVITADGKHVIVRLNAEFAVIDQQEMTGRGPGGPGHGPGHGPGAPATGDDRTKASDAAVAEVPGATVLEVFVRDEGGYAVLLRTDTGEKKVVLLDTAFVVQSVQTPPKPPRHHGQRGQDVTGEAFTKAQAAATAKVDGGTVMDVHKVGSRYHAMVRKDNGRMVVVVMNSDFEVTGTKRFSMKRHHDMRPAPAANRAA